MRRRNPRGDRHLQELYRAGMAGDADAWWRWQFERRRHGLPLPFFENVELGNYVGNVHLVSPVLGVATKAAETYTFLGPGAREVRPVWKAEDGLWKYGGPIYATNLAPGAQAERVAARHAEFFVTQVLYRRGLLQPTSSEPAFPNIGEEWDRVTIGDLPEPYPLVIFPEYEQRHGYRPRPSPTRTHPTLPMEENPDAPAANRTNRAARTMMARRRNPRGDEELRRLEREAAGGGILETAALNAALERRGLPYRPFMTEWDGHTNNSYFAFANGTYVVVAVVPGNVLDFQRRHYTSPGSINSINSDVVSVSAYFGYPPDHRPLSSAHWTAGGEFIHDPLNAPNIAYADIRAYDSGVIQRSLARIAALPSMSVNPPRGDENLRRLERDAQLDPALRAALEAERNRHGLVNAKFLAELVPPHEDGTWSAWMLPINYGETDPNAEYNEARAEAGGFFFTFEDSRGPSRLAAAIRQRYPLMRSQYASTRRGHDHPVLRVWLTRTCESARRGGRGEPQWVSDCSEQATGLDPWSGSALCERHLQPHIDSWRAHDRRMNPRGDEHRRELARRARQGDPEARAEADREFLRTVDHDVKTWKLLAHVDDFAEGFPPELMVEFFERLLERPRSYSEELVIAGPGDRPGYIEARGAYWTPESTGGAGHWGPWDGAVLAHFRESFDHHVANYARSWPEMWQKVGPALSRAMFVDAPGFGAGHGAQYAVPLEVVRMWVHYARQRGVPVVPDGMVKSWKRGS